MSTNTSTQTDVSTDKNATYAEPGVEGFVSDWSADKQAFDMPWGKLIM